MFKTVVLDGDLTVNSATLNGEFGVVTRTGGHAYPVYDGETTVVPKVASEQVLETAMKTLMEDITVEKISVHVTSNPQGGNTVYIGGDISYG